jgi:hypothetical protein
MRIGSAAPIRLSPCGSTRSRVLARCAASALVPTRLPDTRQPFRARLPVPDPHVRERQSDTRESHQRVIARVIDDARDGAEHDEQIRDVPHGQACVTMGGGGGRALTVRQPRVGGILDVM